MTFAAILSEADSPLRVEIHTILEVGWRRGDWLLVPVAQLSVLNPLARVALDIRPPPDSRPGGLGPSSITAGRRCEVLMPIRTWRQHGGLRRWGRHPGCCGVMLCAKTTAAVAAAAVTGEQCQRVLTARAAGLELAAGQHNVS